jgi:hypothetical protein
VTLGADRRNEMLRQVAEAQRRRKRALDAFNFLQRDGLLPGWVSCGFCRAQTIVYQLQVRQHICCVMCGAQMIADVRIGPDNNSFLMLTPVTRGPPYREWSWDP